MRNYLYISCTMRFTLLLCFSSLLLVLFGIINNVKNVYVSRVYDTKKKQFYIKNYINMILETCYLIFSFAFMKGTELNIMRFEKKIYKWHKNEHKRLCGTSDYICTIFYRFEWKG